MFDVDSLDLAAAMSNSDDYKLVRSGPLLYVFPDNVDFEVLAHRNEYLVWTKSAVLVVDVTTGVIRKNRFGRSSDEEW